MTVATLGFGHALLGHQQWREKPGVHAPQTKARCLQADEREATALHPANQENVARRRFIYASRARQQEYRKLAARRLQNRDRQAAPKTRPRNNIILGKRGCQNGPKKGTAARSHFCDRSKQNRARQVLAALPVAHPRARMPLAPLTLPALAIPCSWPAICIDVSDTLDKRQIRTRSDPAASTT